MLAYPITLKQDGDTVLAASKDFPELTTFGDDREDALFHARDALEEAIAARMAAHGDIPAPSPSRNRNLVCVGTETALKVLLYRAMRDQDVTKAALGRRLDWHGPQVDRVLNIHHASRIEHIDAALAALDQRVSVSLAKA